MKYILPVITGLVCAMTVRRILTRLAFEAGVHSPVPLVAVVPTVLVLLAILVYSFFAKNEKLLFLLCYGIALDLAMIGLQKWFGLQAHTHMALLDDPFSTFSTEDLSWAYFGRSPGFLTVVGFLQIVGALLLVFGRTRLVGALVLLPVMTHICLMDFFYHFEAGELIQALVLLAGLVCVLLSEGPTLLLLLRRVAPMGWRGIVGRLSVIYIPLLLILVYFHLPDYDPYHGKYKVTHLQIDGRDIDPGHCGDSVLTTVYLDEGRDCVFEFNKSHRWWIGRYTIVDDEFGHIEVAWHYPVQEHDTLRALFSGGPGKMHIYGHIGKTPISMDWEAVPIFSNK